MAVVAVGMAVRVAGMAVRVAGMTVMARTDVDPHFRGACHRLDDSVNLEFRDSWRLESGNGFPLPRE